LVEEDCFGIKNKSVFTRPLLLGLFECFNCYWNHFKTDLSLQELIRLKRFVLVVEYYQDEKYAEKLLLRLPKKDYYSE